MQCACWKVEAPKQGQVQKAKTQEEQQKQQQQHPEAAGAVQRRRLVQTRHVQANGKRLYSHFRGSATSEKQFSPATNNCSAQQ